MRQVFISYSSKEADQANKIVEALEKQGIRCWIAPRDIGIGSNYTKDIPSAIKECSYFLLVLSRESQQSKWVNKELTRAINQDKHIMPLMIEDFSVSEGFEFLLEDVQTRRYYQTREQTLKEVIAEIGCVTHQTGSASAAAPAVEKLSPEEMYSKGKAYYDAKNYADAVKWYQKAAEQGNAGAQFFLGWCYERGRGVIQDYKTAVKWYEKAAEQGDADAQYNLGVCYENGYGVIQDNKTAVKWYEKAAAQGKASGQRALGYCYQKGYGVVQDYSCALMWYRKAAEQGNINAMNDLGVCYRNGYGVTRDDKTGVMWYEQAAAQGHVSAQYNLALCYKYGRGVRKNLTEAKKWYQKAADQGHKNAKKALEELQ